MIDNAIEGGVETDFDFLRRAVGLADLDAVRVALYQQTSDPELAALPLAAAMDEAQRARLTDKAVDWLTGNAGPRALAEPPEPDLRRLMDMAVGGPMGDLEFEARRDLTGFKPFPFAVHWQGDRPPIPEGFKVAIIGSGFAGVTMAVQLDLLDIPYMVIERRPEPGGVWSVNRYPDVRVDTSSVTYEFQFVKDHPWTEYFGRGNEVQQYVAHVSKTSGVYPKTLFSHDLKTACFDEARNVWTLDLDGPDGKVTLEANVVVSASGLFATPNIPRFEGEESFKGQIVHPSRWPADLDAQGPAGGDARQRIHRGADAGRDRAQGGARVGVPAHAAMDHAAGQVRPGHGAGDRLAAEELPRLLELVALHLDGAPVRHPRTDAGRRRRGRPAGGKVNRQERRHAREVLTAYIAARDGRSGRTWWSGSLPTTRPSRAALWWTTAGTAP